MQQIAELLGSLGMSEYTQRFAENDIDFAVLRDLTDQDLKDLGVSLGHRRKLLDAIAALRVDGNAKAPPSDAPPTIDGHPKDTAERRQVTVMFSDLVARRHSPPAWTRNTFASPAASRHRWTTKYCRLSMRYRSHCTQRNW